MGNDFVRQSYMTLFVGAKSSISLIEHGLVERA